MNFELIYITGGLVVFLSLLGFALFSYLLSYIDGVDCFEMVVFGTFAASIWFVIAAGLLLWGVCQILQKIRWYIGEYK